MIDLRFLLAPGNHAARPAANTVGKGALYFCTEHAKIYRSDLSTWTDALTGVTGTPGTVTSVSGTAPISVATGTTTPAITHDTSGVSAGTSSGITVDTKGHVTARTALVAGDVPSLDTSKLTTGVLPVARGGTDAGTASGARTNLGLGGAAVLNVGTGAGTVAAGDDSRFSKHVLAVTNQSGVLTLDSSHSLIVSDGADITFPSAASHPGRVYWIMTFTPSPIVIADGSDELFDRGTDIDGIALADHMFYIWVSDGATRWYAVRST